MSFYTSKTPRFGGFYRVAAIAVFFGLRLSLEIIDARYFSTTKCTWFVASLNWGNSDVSAANSRTFSYASGSSFLSDSNSGAMPPRNP